MIKGSGVFDIYGKTLFKCLTTYASEPEVYGIDFYESKTYYGQRVDNEYWYLDSTENGTDVLVSNEELEEYFKEV
jgi:hypothetical protein